MDFTSFYSSIGCQFGLSIETVRVLTVQQFLLKFGQTKQIDVLIECGLLRIFDYEPSDSKAVRINRRDCSNDDDGRQERLLLRGRDEMAAGVLATSSGWYEGVEFANAREIIDTSIDVRKRRILIVYRPSAEYVPVVSGLWNHYLTMRKRYKEKLRELKACTGTDVLLAQQHVYECMEKMLKIIANSLYGYLNCERSVVYAPAVAAAVTLLSRKTFHETTWICERLFPRTIGERAALSSDEANCNDSNETV